MTTPAAEKMTSKQSIQAYYQPVLPYLDTVREKLLNIVPPESQLLAEALHHSLGTGGKLLRPVVCLLACGATGKIKDSHLETSAISEMIHIATLLHDDVLDDADLRRGKVTVRSLWGNPVSILSGDYLLAQASRKLAQVGSIRIVSIYSDVLADLCDGEVEQIRASYNLDALDWDSYYRKTICKTATLFSAGCEAAGVLNDLPEEHVQKLKQFGKNFGIAFQIVDDLLDYTSNEADMGKPVFDDLKNGLVNAPVLLALKSDQALNDTEKTEFKQVIRRFFDVDATSKNEATELVQSIQMYLGKARAIEETQALAESFITKALNAIDFLPNTPEKEALIGLGRFVIERKT